MNTLLIYATTLNTIREKVRDTIGAENYDKINSNPKIIYIGIGILSLCACLSGWMAKRKNRSLLLWGILGFMLGPVGLVIIAILKPKTEKNENKDIAKKGEDHPIKEWQESEWQDFPKTTENSPTSVQIADQDSFISVPVLDGAAQDDFVTPPVVLNTDSMDSNANQLESINSESTPPEVALSKTGSADEIKEFPTPEKPTPPSQVIPAPVYYHSELKDGSNIEEVNVINGAPESLVVMPQGDRGLIVRRNKENKIVRIIANDGVKEVEIRLSPAINKNLASVLRQYSEEN